MFYGESPRIGISPFVATVASWEVGDRVIAEVTVPALGKVTIAACGAEDTFTSADRLSPRFIQQLNALHSSSPIRFVEPTIGGIAVEKSRELSFAEREAVAAEVTEVDELLRREPEKLTMLAA